MPRAAPGERIIETWGAGRFPFAQIESKGIHIGYGVTCGLHTNADGYAAGTACKKTISGAEHLALGEEEIKLRLKRWVAAGLVQHFEPPRERQGHINCGGKGLRDLGSDGSWGDLGHAELDAILAPG